jgi:hypothetical protein
VPPPPQLATPVEVQDSNLADVSPPTNQWEREWWRQFGQAYSGWPPGYQPIDPSVHLNVTVQTVEFAGDGAVARVILNADKGQAYRQTWFYRRTSVGWLRTERNADLWGPQRSHDTRFVTFHYRQQDAPAVLAVGPQVNHLYTTLRRNLGLPLTPWAEKLMIDVSVTQSPGAARFQPQSYQRFVPHDRLVVASPAVYLAPVELTDADLLAQSIVLPLIEQVLAQARELHAIGSVWLPLLDGLRLWQVWDLDLPLAAWREDIVQWLYVDLPALEPGQSYVLPERYAALCAAHKLWLPDPFQLNIPLLCGRPTWEAQFLRMGRALPTRLEELVSRPLAESLFDPPPASHPGRTVALATLIEYAAATYGRERLPVLVASLGQYDSWDTLLPAVYGVSPAEFEAGWRAYLGNHYAVSVTKK